MANETPEKKAFERVEDYKLTAGAYHALGTIQDPNEAKSTALQLALMYAQGDREMNTAEAMGYNDFLRLGSNSSWGQRFKIDNEKFGNAVRKCNIEDLVRGTFLSKGLEDDVLSLAVEKDGKVVVGDSVGKYEEYKLKADEAKIILKRKVFDNKENKDAIKEAKKEYEKAMKELDEQYGDAERIANLMEIMTENGFANLLASAKIRPFYAKMQTPKEIEKLAKGNGEDDDSEDEE